MPYLLSQPESPYRAPNGAYRTYSLFYENTYGDGGKAVYSLSDDDVTSPQGNFYPSLFRLYMKEEDQTEYEFATKHLYSWQHWEELLSKEWFKPIIERWRKELDLKIKARALRVLNEEAQDKTSKNRFSAVKILLDRSWDTEKQSVGRPKKIIKEETFDTTEDYERLQSVLEGDKIGQTT